MRLPHVIASIVLGIGLLACGPQVEGPNPDAATSRASSSSGAGDSEGRDSTGDSGSTASIDDGADTETAPYPGEGLSCSIADQGCPEGGKCTWVADDGAFFGDERCVGLVPDPDAIGEACTFEVPIDGHDSCERGAICEAMVTGEEAICRGACDGYASPLCDGPATGCYAPLYLTPVYLCAPTCDPLAPDCLPDQGCFGTQLSFFCAPSYPYTRGLAGDECTEGNECVPGLACIDDSYVPGCGGPNGCCAEFCEPDGPAVDCPMPGTCVPWSQVEVEVPGYVHVGVCADIP